MIPETDEEIQFALRREILGAADAALAASPFRKELDEVKAQTRRLGERLSLPPGSPGPSRLPGDGELPGKQFVNSAEFRAWASAPGQRGRCAVRVPLSTKAATNIITNVVAPSGAIRMPDISGYPIAPPAMLALIPSRPTSGDKVSYLRLKARPTPGAKSQILQADVKAEQSFDVGAFEVDVATIASWTSASTQALSDVEQLARFIDSTLTALTLDEADRQTLLGGGATVGELDGILAAAIPYNVAATLTGDTVLDVLSHAHLQLASAGIVATAAVVGPGDAEKARLVKDTTGGYVLQQPTVGALPNLWSMQIAVDVHMPANQFLVGRFASDSIELLDRQMALVEVSREQSDYFVRNLVALRCELRAALAMYQPNAFVAGTFTLVGTSSARTGEPEGRRSK